MRDEYIKLARAVVEDPFILVNIVSLRVKQLRQGSRPLIESLESLTLADVALREIGEGKISYELAEGGQAPKTKPRVWRDNTKSASTIKKPTVKFYGN